MPTRDILGYADPWPGNHAPRAGFEPPQAADTDDQKPEAGGESRNPDKDKRIGTSWTSGIFIRSLESNHRLRLVAVRG